MTERAGDAAWDAARAALVQEVAANAERIMALMQAGLPNLSQGEAVLALLTLVGFTLDECPPSHEVQEAAAHVLDAGQILARLFVRLGVVA